MNQKNYIFIILILIQLNFSLILNASSPTIITIEEVKTTDDIEMKWAIIHFDDSKDLDIKVELYEKLLTSLENLIPTYSNPSELLIWKAILLASIAEGKKFTALFKIQEPIKILKSIVNSNDSDILQGLAKTNLAILKAYVPPADPTSAEKLFNEVLTKFPNSIDANYNFAEFLEKVDDGKRKKEALDLYKKIITLKPRENQTYADESLIQIAKNKVIKLNQK